MKILVTGCSFSSGWGFEKGINDRRIWPSLVCESLNASLENWSETGSDNTGIYLNTIDRIDLDNWDLVLVQFTALDRIILRAVPESDKLITEENPIPNWLSDSEYSSFYRVMVLLNGRLLHWFRLCKMIRHLQTRKNLYFINGLLDWDQEFWRSCSGPFLDRMFSPWTLVDQQIKDLVPMIEKNKKTIDCSKWINRDHNWNCSRIDHISDHDAHPGINSHKKYAHEVLEFLKNKL